MGDGDAADVTICDVIPDNMVFASNAYTNQSPNDGGLIGVESGVALGFSTTGLPVSPTNFMTNVMDADRAQFFPPGMQAPPTANAPLFATPLPGALNTTGVLCVNVVTGFVYIPKANAPGIPTNSYGYIRFRAKVE